MLTNRLFTAAAASALLATTLSAQQPCSDNLWPIHIVDAQGVEAPVEFDAAIGEDTFVLSSEQVFLAFDPNLPSGTYYVHTTDTPVGDGNDNVMSANDPMDRFVTVENNNGVISLSLPFSNDPSQVEFGVGLGGVGQSINVGPFLENQISGCRFKLWYGDKWDLTYGPTDPYILGFGVHPDGSCVVRSYHSFRIGDGSGGDVTGTVFDDVNENGVQDNGEAGLPGWEVSLNDDLGVVALATTDGNGVYTFENAGAGDFTVALTLQAGFVATGESSGPVTSCACADKEGPNFGVQPEGTTVCCDARTIGFWRNSQGRALVCQYNILGMLPSLCIVNKCGQQVSPSNIWAYKSYMKKANSWNMAYMLSAQLVAMHNNVVVGFVDENCVIEDDCLGTLTVGELIQQAVASLCAHPFTPPCTGAIRQQQRRLKDALDDANNNLNWANSSCGCDDDDDDDDDNCGSGGSYGGNNCGSSWSGWGSNCNWGGYNWSSCGSGSGGGWAGGWSGGWSWMSSGWGGGCW